MIQVKVKKLGYFNSSRVYPGDILNLQNEQEFSSKWMERITPTETEQEPDLQPVVETTVEPEVEVSDEVVETPIEEAKEELVIDLSKLTKAQLTERAKELNIQVDNSLNKADIIALLEQG